MTQKPSHDRLIDGVTLVLGVNGIANRRFGLPHKPQQLAYALQWCKALAAGQVDASRRTALMLLSADTGLGKTLGYAVPLLLYASLTSQRVLIATKTLSLQQQMSAPGGDLDMALDAVAEVTGLPRLRIALRPGQQAYLSPSNISRLLDVLRDEPGADLARSGLQELLDYAQDDAQTGLYEDAVNDLHAGIAPAWMVRAQLTLNAASDPADQHKYRDAVKTADDADVVLIAQHLLASSAFYGTDMIGVAPFGALVVDEADQLGEVARDQGMSSLSLAHLSGVLVRSSVRRDHAIFAALERFSETLSDAGEGRQAAALVSLTTQQREAISAHAQEILKPLAALVRQGSISPDAQAQLVQAEATFSGIVAAHSGTRFKGQEPQGCVLNFSPVRRYPTISLVPIAAARKMSRLWKKHWHTNADAPFRAVLLTSATLATPSLASVAGEADFADIARELGADASRTLASDGDDSPRVNLMKSEWRSFEPSSFGRMRLILADPVLRSPIMTAIDDGDEFTAITDDEWRNYVGAMIHHARQAGGRTLVLTRAFADAQALVEAYTAAGGCASNVLVHRRGSSLATLVLSYRANPAAILLTPVGWEGLNLPGLVQNLVIPRLPYFAADPVKIALLRAIYPDRTASGIEAAERHRLTLRVLRQGIGRGIRAQTDKCRVFIGDPRFPLHPGCVGSKVLEHSAIRRNQGLHAAVPQRFRHALRSAQVLLRDGRVFSEE